MNFIMEYSMIIFVVAFLHAFIEHSQNLMPEHLVYRSDSWEIREQVDANVSPKLHHMLQHKFADKVICCA